jgi:tagaturonate reductase
MINAQDGLYTLYLRGIENGQVKVSKDIITSIKESINPYSDWAKTLEYATSNDLRFVISNTTEAGICFNSNDDFNGFENITYPAKLTKFLLERFKAGKDGVYLMPVELIDNNADELKKCVDKYIELWNLPKEFKKWNEEKNYYCNTLVDRIVSGYPKTAEDVDKIEKLIGNPDKLVSIGEPFGLWAVEKKGNIDKYIKDGVHNIEVVLTENIKYYKKRKVRVLNGSHTNIVPVGLWHGAVTVYDCMTDKKLCKFLQDTLTEEIVPFVSNDIAATTVFADSITERFLNPYLNHLLTSISLNSISKWRARDLPSFKDYYEKYGEIPAKLTVGFSYLMAIYSAIEKRGDEYFVKLPSREITIQDDKPYLEYFANKNSLKDFMSDENVWGEDLTKYDNFYDLVEENIKKINKGIDLI